MVVLLSQVMMKHDPSHDVPQHSRSKHRRAVPEVELIQLPPELAKRNLTKIVSMLRDQKSMKHDWQGKRFYGRADCARLFRMVTAWDEARRDLGYDGIVQRMQFTDEDRKRLETFTLAIHLSVLPDGNLMLDDSHGDPATRCFSRLCRSSKTDQDRLYACPSNRLHRRDKWGVRKPGRKKVFCSRECAREWTQVKNRKSARDKKLKSIRETIETYDALPQHSIHRQSDWRTYVLKELKETISKKFLTQVIKSGEVSPPGRD